MALRSWRWLPVVCGNLILVSAGSRIEATFSETFVTTYIKLSQNRRVPSNFQCCTNPTSHLGWKQKLKGGIKYLYHLSARTKDNRGRTWQYAWSSDVIQTRYILIWSRNSNTSVPSPHSHTLSVHIIPISVQWVFITCSQGWHLCTSWLHPNPESRYAPWCSCLQQPSESQQWSVSETVSLCFLQCPQYGRCAAGANHKQEHSGNIFTTSHMHSAIYI